jgi:hypothetical protein
MGKRPSNAVDRASFLLGMPPLVKKFDKEILDELLLKDTDRGVEQPGSSSGS